MVKPGPRQTGPQLKATLGRQGVGMSRSKCAAIVPALIVLLSFVGAVTAPARSAAEVVGDQVVSQAGAYSLTLPPDWTLADEAQEGDGVHLLHEESGAYFWIEIKASRGTIDEELKVLKIALPFAGGAWHLESDGYRKIGGKRAGEVVSTRTLPGESPLILHSYVVVYKKHAYLMEFGVARPKADEREADRLKILESFTWLKKQKK